MLVCVILLPTAWNNNLSTIWKPLKESYMSWKKALAKLPPFLLSSFPSFLSSFPLSLSPFLHFFLPFSFSLMHYYITLHTLQWHPSLSWASLFLEGKKRVLLELLFAKTKEWPEYYINLSLNRKQGELNACSIFFLIVTVISRLI